MGDFHIKKKIYYHDTDCGNVVYYANYLKYMEEARTELMISRGLSLKKMADEGTLFVVARVEADYKAPALYQDEICAHAVIEDISRASITFGQNITRDGRVLINARVVLVCVNSRFRPQSIPQDVREALTS